VIPQLKSRLGTHWVHNATGQCGTVIKVEQLALGELPVYQLEASLVLPQGPFTWSQDALWAPSLHDFRIGHVEYVPGPLRFHPLTLDTYELESDWTRAGEDHRHDHTNPIWLALNPPRPEPVAAPEPPQRKQRRGPRRRRWPRHAQ
jgi:hypothetical protein